MIPVSVSEVPSIQRLSFVIGRSGLCLKESCANFFLFGCNRASAKRISILVFRGDKKKHLQRSDEYNDCYKYFD